MTSTLMEPYSISERKFESHCPKPVHRNIRKINQQLLPKRPFAGALEEKEKRPDQSKGSAAMKIHMKMGKNKNLI